MTMPPSVKGWAGPSLAAILLSAFTACASQQPPPPSPTATQIASTAAEIAAAGVPPADYASIGITLASENCASWFSQQVMEAQQAKFGGQALSMLGSIGGAVGGPYGTGTAVGAAAIANLLGAYQAASPAGVTPASVYGLISRVQKAWRDAMPVPLSTADAYALVAAYWEQCSLPAIQNAVTQALNSVPVSAAIPVSVATIPLAPTPSSIEPAPHPPTARAQRSARSERQTRSIHRPPPPSEGSSGPSAPDHVQPNLAWDQWGRPFQSRMPQVFIGSPR